MEEILKGIRKIIGTNWDSVLGVKFYGDEIVFSIYDSEIPICVDKKLNVFIDTEIIEYKLTTSLLEELSKITKLLEENKAILNEFLYETLD